MEERVENCSTGMRTVTGDEFFEEELGVDELDESFRSLVSQAY